MDVDETRVPPKDNAEGSPEKPDAALAEFGAPLLEPQARELIASMTKTTNVSAESLLATTKFSLTDDKRLATTGGGEDLRFTVSTSEASNPGDRTKGPENIKRDAQGRVTEVVGPDGKSRQFGYDEKGEVNRVVQPNGETYVRKDGKWQIDGKPGDSLDFHNARVSDKGDLSYERKDGSRITQFADGTRQTSKDGAYIFHDAKDRISYISYANGTYRSFSYDDQGKIASFSENGKHYLVDGLGKISGPNGPTDLRAPMVGPDGSFSLSNDKGDVTTTFADGRQTIAGADRSQIHKRADGKITEIGYPDGTNRKFDYDQSGRLNSITDRDGKQYNFNATFDFFGTRSGDFRAADGTTLGGATLAPDGTLKYQDKDGKIRTDYTNGATTTTTRTAAELQQIAAGLHQNNWIFTDNADIKKVLDGLSPVDRVALDDQYKQLFGQSLSGQLRDQTWNPLKLENTQAALASLSEAHVRAAVSRNFANPQDAAAATKLIDEFKERAKQQGLSPEQLAAGFDKALKDLNTPGADWKKLETLESSLTGAAPTLTSLETKYGVKRAEVVRPDGSKIQQYYVEGERGARLPVLETTGDNPREIERQLQAWRDAKIKELEGRHNLQFSGDNQVEKLQGRDTTLRAPRIDELLGFEQALAKSQPSDKSSNGLPLRVLFPTTPTLPGADAYVPARQPGVPERIVFEPLTRTFEDFKDTTRHELAHIGQRNIRDRDPAALSRLAEATGYRQLTTEQGGNQWQLKGKDGHYYTQNPTDSSRQTWTRVDEKGRPLKADGTPAKDFADKDAVSISRDAMRERAAVKPATDYFPNPIENGAEALHLFRGDAGKRESLFLTSPDLYRAIKEYDQREIDADPRFGKDANGTSKFIRLPDGTVGENNEANRKAVSEYEQTLSTLSQSRYSPPGQSKPQGDAARDSGASPTHQHLPNFSCPSCK